MKTVLPSLALLLLLSSCIKPPQFPDTPEIEFIGFNSDVVPQGSPNAEQFVLEITFSFTDGDGDIGSEEENNVFLTDSRDGSVTPFKVEPIPEQGNGNGISGEITVRMVNTPRNICCTFPNGLTPCTPSTAFPTDVMHFSILLKDRAGNESNIIQTSDLTILCQ